MRIFKKFNDSHDAKCPVCKTAEMKEAVLVSIYGTQEGNIAEAIQVHLECIELAYDRDLNIFYQKLN